MFREQLKYKIEQIFGIPKVTFDFPGERKERGELKSIEQESVMIQVDKSNCRVKSGKEYARAQGSISVFANSDKLPFGYFAKRIEQADPDLTKDIFFYDIDESSPVIQNVVDRTLRFVFLYSGDYNPNNDQIDSIKIVVEDS